MNKSFLLIVIFCFLPLSYEQYQLSYVPAIWVIQSRLLYFQNPALYMQLLNQSNRPSKTRNNGRVTPGGGNGNGDDNEGTQELTDGEGDEKPAEGEGDEKPADGEGEGDEKPADGEGEGDEKPAEGEGDEKPAEGEGEGEVTGAAEGAEEEATGELERRSVSDYIPYWYPNVLNSDNKQLISSVPHETVYPSEAVFNNAAKATNNGYFSQIWNSGTEKVNETVYNNAKDPTNDESSRLRNDNLEKVGENIEMNPGLRKYLFSWLNSYSPFQIVEPDNVFLSRMVLMVRILLYFTPFGFVDQILFAIKMGNIVWRAVDMYNNGNDALSIAMDVGPDIAYATLGETVNLSKMDVPTFINYIHSIRYLPMPQEKEQQLQREITELLESNIFNSVPKETKIMLHTCLADAVKFVCFYGQTGSLKLTNEREDTTNLSKVLDKVKFHPSSEQVQSLKNQIKQILGSNYYASKVTNMISKAINKFPF